MTLPGPTGESNELHIIARGTLLCLGPAESDIAAQKAMAEAAGCVPLVATLDHAMLASNTTFDAVAWFGDAEKLGRIRGALAGREGAILPLLTSVEETSRLQHERHVCIETTAAGGNATLIAQAG